MKALKQIIGIVVVIAVFVFIQRGGAIFASSGNPPAEPHSDNSTNSTSRHAGLATAVLKVQQIYSDMCDRVSDAQLVSPKYGQINKDILYDSVISLQTPVEAVITGVEYVCWQNALGLKEKRWVYMTVGYDREFTQYRCYKLEDATEWAPDGNHTLRFNPEKKTVSEKTTAREEVESFAARCGFALE